VLAGKAPGVQVVQPSGNRAPISASVSAASARPGREPIYVIDGVIAIDTKSLDPNDIESISVLKDASAAGIYGSAGSTNGVVLITTKHGNKGRPDRGDRLYRHAADHQKAAGAQWQQYLALMTDEYTNAGQYTPEPLRLYANNNWQDLVYHQAMQTGANANFSGGSPKGTWFLGLGYLDQDGIVHTSNFKRYSVNFKLDQNMNNWLSVGGNIAYNRTYQTTSPTAPAPNTAAPYWRRSPSRRLSC
jgi:TonB-dependent SusC/RagA subfamily outer membrane receptor